jgi:hypothetical protein
MKKIAWLIITLLFLSSFLMLVNFPMAKATTTETTLTAIDDFTITHSAIPYNANWTQVWGNTTGTNIYSTLTAGVGGISSSPPPEVDAWVIQRGFVVFNTGVIPDSATITSAIFSFYLDAEGADDGNLTLQSGGGIYPHSPPVLNDYYYGQYSLNGVGGSKNVTTMTGGTYNNITLTSTGISWVQIEGSSANTTFCLRSTLDINGTDPSTYRSYGYWAEMFWLDGIEEGHPSKLYITYTTPDATPPEFLAPWDFNVPHYDQMRIKARWNDSSALSMFMFSDNRSGSWTNGTWIEFAETSPPQYTDLVTYDLLEGEDFYAKCYANDTYGNVGVSTEIEIEYVAQNIVQFSITGEPPKIDDTVTVHVAVTHGGLPLSGGESGYTLNITKDGAPFQTNYINDSFTDTEHSVKTHTYTASGLAIAGDSESFSTNSLEVNWQSRGGGGGGGGGGGSGGGKTSLPNVDLSFLTRTPSWAIWLILGVLGVVFVGGVSSSRTKSKTPKRSFRKHNTNRR